MAGEIFGIAMNYESTRGLFFVAEGPAGQPLKIRDIMHEQTMEGVRVWLAKRDFLNQADVDAYVAARSAPAQAYTPNGRWVFFPIKPDLVFTVQPSNTAHGVAITPAMQVTARDALGNVCTPFTGLVSLGIAIGTGATGAVLSGTTLASAVAGVATFAGMSINLASATPYRLVALSDGARNSAQSDPFIVT